MIDFKVTKNGDIDLVQSYQYPRFFIQFMVSHPGLNSQERRFPSLRLDFDTDVKQHKPVKNNSFIMQFRTALHEPKGQITTGIVYNQEELAQEVMIRLKTELGEFENLQDFGSELALLRHTDINTEITKELAKQYAETALTDVITEEPLTISVAWEDDKSRYQFERLKITADTGNTTLYEADI